MSSKSTDLNTMTVIETKFFLKRITQGIIMFAKMTFVTPNGEQVSPQSLTTKIMGKGPSLKKIK